MIKSNPFNKEVYDARTSSSLGIFPRIGERIDTIESIIKQIAPGGGSSQSTFLVSGGQVIWIGGYSFRVSAANYYINGINYSSVEQVTTLDPSDPVNDRIDIIYVDNTGTVGNITGTAAPNPSEPDTDPTTQLKLAFVYVSANTVAPSGISNEDIYLENTEWSTSTSGSGWNANSTNNPRTGAKDVEGTTVSNGAYVQFDKGVSLNTNLYNYLVLYIRSKASWNTNRIIRLQFLLNGVAVGTAITIARGFWGFDDSITSGYQQVAIPISQFQITPGNLIDQLRITDVGGSIGLYVDDIILQTNSAFFQQLENNGITQTEADARYLQRSLNLSDVSSGLAARINIGAHDASNLITGTLPDDRLTNTGPGVLGPVGNSVTIPIISIDAKGRVTALSSTSVSGDGGTVSLTYATTSVSGEVYFAVNGESVSGKAVQAHDSRLSDSRLPNGSAGGDLSGTYPNPLVVSATTTVSGKVLLAEDGDTFPGKVVQSQDYRLSNSRTPTGSAGGDLTGFYPNPILINVGPGVTGPIGSPTTTPVISIDANGRVTALSSSTIVGTSNTSGFYSYTIREAPSGTADGINTVFVLANTPLSGSEEVYLNQGLQNVGASNDYTIFERTITFNNPPTSGSVLLVSYIRSIGGTPSHASTHSSSGGDPVFIDASQVNSGILDSARIPVTISSRTVSSSAYTFVLADAGIVVESTGSSGANFTIPTTGSVNFLIGTIMEVHQYGSGQVTIVADSGIILRSNGSKVKTAAQYSSIGLRHRALGEWVLTGDLTT